MLKQLFKPTINHASLSDKLNTKWNFIVLLLLSIITGLRQCLGPNAVCITPPTSDQQLNEYIDQTCWLSRQMVLKHDVIPFHNRDVETLPLLQNENRKFKNRDIKMSLYQWLPMILAMQTLLVTLPEFLVKTCDTLLGIRFSKIINHIMRYPELNRTEKDAILDDMTEYLNEYFRSRSYKRRRFGKISILLVVCKLLIVVNVLTQLILFNFYVSPLNVQFYGLYILRSIITTKFDNSTISHSFPRQIQCLVYIRRPQHLQIQSVQCSLPTNEMYEQVCMIVWILLFISSCAAVISLIVYLVKAFTKTFNNRLIERYLSMAEIVPGPQELTSFVDSVLGYDGIILLEVIGEVSSDILERDIVINFWKSNYIELKSTGQSVESIKPNFVNNNHKLRVQLNGVHLSSYSMDETPQSTPLIERRCVQGV